MSFNGCIKTLPYKFITIYLILLMEKYLGWLQFSDIIYIGVHT